MKKNKKPKVKRKKHKTKCLGCGNNIPVKRLKILPNTKVCVSCSTTGKKSGTVITLGEGDHTYNETIIFDSKISSQFNKQNIKREDGITHPEYDIEEIFEEEDDGFE